MCAVVPRNFVGGCGTELFDNESLYLYRKARVFFNADTRKTAVKHPVELESTG